MSFIHFRDWFNKEPIQLDEKKAPAVKTEINATKKNLEKYNQYMPELLKYIGSNGIIPTEEEAAKMLQNQKYNGFFWRKDDLKYVGSSARSNDDKLQAELALNTLETNHVEFQDLKDSMYIVMHDGFKIKLTATGKGITVAEAGKEVITPKYFIDETGTQESITAAVLNILNKPTKIDGIISPQLAEFIGEKGIKKIEKHKNANFIKWLITSNPKLKTGICSQLDYSHADPLYFQKELYNFLEGAWLKHFINLYNSKIINEISTVYTDGFDMSHAKFLHFNMYGYGVSSILGKYLRDGRAGVANKDELDKGDIILCTDINAANAALKDLMTNYKDTKSYCTAVNKYIINKVLIPISLKQTKNLVNLAAVNFKSFTTASGDNIADDKKVIVKYYNKGNKENTFDFSNAECTHAKDGISSYIKVPILNPKHLITHENVLTCRVGSNSSKFGVIIAEFAIEHYPAQLGKCTSALSKFGISLASELNSRISRNSSDAEIKKAYDYCADLVLDAFKKHPKEMNKIFALGAGYPVQFGADKEPELDSAPYIKIY